MDNRIHFTELARTLGGELCKRRLPNGAEIEEAVWTPALCEKLLEHFRAKAADTDPIEYDGHPAPWVMMAIVHMLRNREQRAYIGAFGKSLILRPYDLGGQEKPDQPAVFRFRELGEALELEVILSKDPAPFRMPMEELAAPVLPAGRDIFVKLRGAHYIFNFPLPLCYGESCRAMYLWDGDAYVCCLSNTAAVQVGDRV